MSAMVECEGLVRIYKSAELEVVALQGLDLEVAAGEVVAIVGASGSGKTTLMNVLSAVDQPSAGKAVVAGRNLAKLTEAERDEYRRDVIGYVWQQTARNAMPELTAEQNVQLALVGARRPREFRRQRADELLSAFGLTALRDRRPAQLSGGERRLLAVSVALANEPEVLFADEPTSGLDRASATKVLGQLREVRNAFGTTVVLVTHDRAAEEHVDRVVRIRDGRTSTETRHSVGERVIVDRTGRLQLPRHLIEEAGISGLVNVRRLGDGILILPAGEDKRDD